LCGLLAALNQGEGQVRRACTHASTDAVLTAPHLLPRAQRRRESSGSRTRPSSASIVVSEGALTCALLKLGEGGAEMQARERGRVLHPSPRCCCSCGVSCCPCRHLLPLIQPPPQ